MKHNTSAKTSLSNTTAAMPDMIDLTQGLTDTLELESKFPRTHLEETMQSKTMRRTSAPATPESISLVIRRKTKPPPIDVDLAQQKRASQKLPYIKTPISTPSEYDPSTPRESTKRTPLYVHIYAQMRSPASSTPFPTEHDTPKKPLMPVTAVFGPPTPSTPSTATNSVSSLSSNPTACHLLKLRTPLTAFATQIETNKYPFARSKRLKRMLTRLVEPIDTELSTLTVNPMWYRARAPIAGRWNLFQRPSQVRLARFAEDAWYGGESKGRKREVSDDEDSEENESDLDSDSGKEGSSSGWSGLPTPISPLVI